MTVYALALDGEQRSWSDIVFWRLKGTNLHLAYHDGDRQVVMVPSKFIGFYAKG